ncbi:MAG: phospholipase D-like domain-containing protein [Francisellaceae bacterium]
MTLFGFLELHTFLLICQILFLIAIVHMIAEKQKPTTMLAWVLAIIVVPYIAVPCYFIFGIRKRKKRRFKSSLTLRKVDHVDVSHPYPIRTVLINEGIPASSSNNAFELYDNGIDAFNAFFEAIQSSSENIYISTYVFQKDVVTLKLIAALIERAHHGVQVRLLIDSLGSWKVYFFHQRLFKKLKKAGAQVRFFMPIIQMPFRNYINFRNHRKIYLFDNKMVLTGGMNLGNEYMGPTPCEKRWDDLLFKIEGSAICYFHNIFCSDWEYASDEILPAINNFNHHKSYGKSSLQVVPSGPDIEEDALYDSMIAGIYMAQSRIWIVTPYFVPSDSLLEALKIAYHRGVDVKLITPKVSNHLIADLARSSFMRQLNEIGIEIALFEKQMIHAKAVLFDDKAVMLGSVNLDYRSLFLNYEVATYAYDQKIVLQIQAWMERLMRNSVYVLEMPSRRRRFGESLVRLLSPIL